jgi:hypothetical protein
MNNRTKKWALVAGCLMLCAVMVWVIGQGFIKAPVSDKPLPVAEKTSGGVTVDPVTAKEPVITTDPDTLSGADPAAPGADLTADNPQTGNLPDIVIQPNPQSPAASGDDGKGAVSTGTEQTIQTDPAKPEYDEETLTDPAKTPEGTPVTEPPQHTDHDHVVTPPPQDRPAGSGLPGFDNIPNAGPNQGTQADDMYENGNKIGIMG